MSTLSNNHKELTNGVGKCSVPMWSGALPSGFCDNEAYSERPKGKEYQAHGTAYRLDGRYSGYVPALACPAHGGLKKEEVVNLCDFCTHHVSTCNSNPKFGIGKGNDNVFECESFKTTTNHG